MSNDDQPSSGKSTTAAMTNGSSRKSRKHPWHVPYLKTCIIKDCRTKPYYDGSTYFTCCLSCLREKELGPFFGNPNPRLYNEAAQTPSLPKVATQDIEPDVELGHKRPVDADGVIIPLDSNDLF